SAPSMTGGASARRAASAGRPEDPAWLARPGPASATSAPIPLATSRSRVRAPFITARLDERSAWRLQRHSETEEEREPRRPGCQDDQRFGELLEAQQENERGGAQDHRRQVDERALAEHEGSAGDG